MMALRLAQPAHLIDIGRIAGLSDLALDGDGLAIGALVRHQQFLAPLGGGVLGRLLGWVGSHIAHLPIRLRGTFCGSLANADPASEWCLVAATLDARITAQRCGGVRVIAAAEFFDGPMTTALSPDEILTGVHIPLPTPGTKMGFYEFNRRAGDFALAMCLVSFRIEGGVVIDPRIGLGGVEEYPRRITEAEDIIAGQPLNKAMLEHTADAAAAAIEPLVDHHTNAAYRRDLARIAVLRAFAHATQTAQKAPADER
jgi:carbon-monoxide dehydrogenase medium subunit